MRITSIRLILVTTDGEKEVTFMEKVPPMDLGQGEFANLSLPIVLDEDDNPIVPMKRLN